MDPDILELKLQERLDAMPKAARAELLHVLMLPRPRADRADRRVLELPAKPRLRGAADRLRGGSDAPSCAGRDASRDGALRGGHLGGGAGVPASLITRMMRPPPGLFYRAISNGRGCAAITTPIDGCTHGHPLLP
ncbi:MAG TPA: hypothetical protein VFY54_00930, partial [Rubrobacter sp.]|nr:hypothetical protein [Rubrobacter sp.]